jgi:excinuclease ABC subunit C
VLYVGKAKNLKNRLTSYTRLTQLRGKTRKLVLTANKLKWQVLSSELEALLVEAELIRIHQPEFNILLKDDKTPLYINITNDAFPLVKTVRKKDVDVGKISGTILGPFPSGYKVKEVLKLVRPIFKWCSSPQNSHHHKIKKQNLALGSKANGESIFVKSIVSETKTDSYPEKSLFKPCFYYHLDMCSGACVRQISAIEYQSDIKELILFLRGKKKEVLTEITRKMKQASKLQKFELAAKLRDQAEVINSVTSHQYRLKPDLILPQLRETKRDEGLTQLRKIISENFKLPRTITLNRIEGYDVSNIQGTDAAVSMVTFIEGRSSPTDYRVFNIKTLNTPNDYLMLKEAITRRQNHPEWGTPDLIVIDGGKGQLRSALSVWSWSCPVISIAKKPDRIIIPEVINNSKIEYKILTLPPAHPALQIIQQVRDESHRFSRRQHHKIREKSLI